MRLHHLNISCSDVYAARSKFLHLFGFHDYGQVPAKSDEYEPIFVLKQNSIFLTLSKNANDLIDTINDIVFCVDSVIQCCHNMKEHGGIVLQQPHIVDCIQKEISLSSTEQSLCNCQTVRCQNYIEKAIIKSPVGNVQHTLLNKKNFTGEFLPGFVLTSSKANTFVAGDISKIDHIAFVVQRGEAASHMNWYRDCLQFLRFKTSIDESESGLVIRGNHGNGLRLLTLDEHPCSSNVISRDSDEVGVGHGHVKLVFCESLSDEG